MSQGFVLWFTGLSGSGKSTLAALVAERLRDRGVHVEALDGDEVRKHLSWGLGFSREDRDRNVLRIGYVARMVARAGACAITAAISPYRAVRDEVRGQAERFCEVYCECPLEVLAERDPKGLYKRALAGELKNFTGVDDPYEEPLAPEVHLHTDRQTPDECVETILARLGELGFVRDEDDATDARLPAPYGGELFSAPVRDLSEGAPLAGDLLVGETVGAACAMLAAGYLSPVSGFMTRREVEKVQTSGHLERGLPWPEPIVLPLKEQPPPPEGRSVRLMHAGQEVARLHVQQVWKSREGRSFAAGPIEAIAPRVALPVTARALRREVERRGWLRFPAYFEGDAPSVDGEQALRTVLGVCDGVVLFVQGEHFARWEDLLGEEPRLIGAEAPPLLSLLSGYGFEEIVARNIGASRVVVSHQEV
jgi:adenylyl-sulfate kinase